MKFWQCLVLGGTVVGVLIVPIPRVKSSSTLGWGPPAQHRIDPAVRSDPTAAPRRVRMDRRPVAAPAAAGASSEAEEPNRVDRSATPPESTITLPLQAPRAHTLPPLVVAPLTEEISAAALSTWFRGSGCSVVVARVGGENLIQAILLGDTVDVLAPMRGEDIPAQFRRWVEQAQAKGRVNLTWRARDSFLRPLVDRVLRSAGYPDPEMFEIWVYLGEAVCERVAARVYESCRRSGREVSNVAEVTLGFKTVAGCALLDLVDVRFQGGQP